MNTRVTFTFVSVAALFVLVLLAGCDDDPQSPGDRLAATYEATTLTVTPADSSTIDVLARGGSITISLASDGTTSGTFVVPASFSEDDEPQPVDLSGMWSVTRDTVTFEHEPDTFLRDTEFEVVGDRLVGEESFGSDTIRAVLTRR